MPTSGQIVTPDKVATYLVDRAPISIKSRLVRDNDVLQACGGDLWTLVGYSGFGQFNQDSFLTAVRRVFETGSTEIVNDTDGYQVEVKLSGDHVVLKYNDGDKQGSERTPDDLSLMHPEQDVRDKILNNMLSEFGPTGPNAEKWKPIILQRALSVIELKSIFHDIRTSIPAVMDTVRAMFLSGNVSIDKLIPDDIDFYLKMCGPLVPPNTSPEQYFHTTLNDFRRDLISRDTVRGIDICCLSFLHKDLYLHECASEISHEELLEILQTLLPLKDPYTALGILDISTRCASKDNKFEEIASECIGKLCGETFKSSTGKNVYAYMPTLVQMIEDRLAVLPEICNQPQYWRKLCAWTHAGLLTRYLDDLEFDESEFNAWCKQYLTFEANIKGLMDLRVEPRTPQLSEGQITLESEIVGRVFNLKIDYEQSEIEWSGEQALERKIERLRDRGLMTSITLPGPLEGHLKFVGEGRELIPELKNNIMGMSDVPLSDTKWQVPLNAVQHFNFDDASMEHIKKEFAAQSIPTDDKLDIALNSLAALGRFGAISRDVEVSNLIAEKCLDAVSKITDFHKVQVIGAILIVAAAANEDEEDYVDWLERQLRMLVEALPMGEPCDYLLNLIRAIRTVGDLPFGSLSQVEALAQLGVR